MKKEMVWLDQPFFEELEDMKFALQQATTMNAAYDQTLIKVRLAPRCHGCLPGKPFRLTLCR